MKSVVLGPATLYLGDAAEIVPTLPKVDLLATDPPWGVEYRSNFGQRFDVIAGDRGEVDVPSILQSCVRRLEEGRHAYVFGPSTLLAGVDGLTPAVELVWDKQHLGMGDLTIPWGPCHEPISFALAYPPKKRRGNRGALAARMRQGSVLRVQRVSSDQIKHPNEKPVEVMRRIVEASSNVGDLVLDPFMGSASTIVAALVSGRRAIGIEIDERYFAAARERVQRILPVLGQLESA